MTVPLNCLPSSVLSLLPCLSHKKENLTLVPQELTVFKTGKVGRPPGEEHRGVSALWFREATDTF